MAEDKLNNGSYTLEELAKLPNFYCPSVSYKKDKVAFYYDQTGRLELYVMDLKTKKITQVTDGEAPKSLRAGFEWSRNDKYIIFCKDKDGNEQHDLYKFDLESHTCTQLTDIPTSQEYIGESSPDGKWFTMMSNRNGQLNLYKIDPQTKEVIQLTDYPNPTRGGSWSPDSQKILYVTNEEKDLKNSDVYIMNSDGSDKKMIARQKIGSRESFAKWSDDGKMIAINSDETGTSRGGIYFVATGEIKWFGTNESEEYAVNFTDDCKKIIALRSKDVTYMPLLYDIETGAEIKLNLPDGIVMGSDTALDGNHIVMSHNDITHKPRLIMYDLTKHEYEILLDADYGSIDPAVFNNAEYISYKSVDGLDIHAILYKPKNIKPGEKLPVIVHIHGGPTSNFTRSFNVYAQFLTDRGYVVLMPNVRGSTGYGVKFRDMALKDWGGMDLEDVVAGVDYLKAISYVDPDRIAIFGGSYGGFMTYMAVTRKPDVWKAACAWIGITDLINLYENSMEHFKYYFKSQMGEPSENEKLWKERSAVNYAGNLKSKLLMVHGVNDPRCNIDQARIFRDELIRLGKKEEQDFEYIELDKEGHGSAEIDQKIRMYNILMDFFKRNL